MYLLILNFISIVRSFFSNHSCSMLVALDHRQLHRRKNIFDGFSVSFFIIGILNVCYKQARTWHEIVSENIKSASLLRPDLGGAGSQAFHQTVSDFISR